MPRLPPLRIPFSDFWSMRIEHPYSMLVRAGGHAWSCGQCPLSIDGAVLAAGDLVAQAEHVDRYIRRLREKADLAPENVGKLVLYHEARDPEAAQRMQSLFQRAYPGAILMPIGTPYFYYPGMLIEVDVHAAERRAPLVTREAGGFRIQAVNAGDLVWLRLEVLGQAAASLDLQGLHDALRNSAAVLPEALLADHWFVGGNDAGPMLKALQHGGLVTDPGSAVRVTLPAGTVAMGELTFAGGGLAASPPTHPRPGVALFVRCSQTHFWIAGRSIASSSLVGETRAIMAAIADTMRERGWRFEAIAKATTHYVGSSSAEDLHENMAVRNTYYSRPGPASTGLPVAAFPFSASKIAVDVLGVLSSDEADDRV